MAPDLLPLVASGLLGFEREWRNEPMNRTVAAMIFTGTLLVSGGAIAGERTVTLAVDNMYCELCPGIVKKSLTKVDGVSQVAVSYEKKTTVTYDDKKATLAALTAATTNAGYPSHPVQ
jgi:periplasmic mercuric ion binding protein